MAIHEATAIKVEKNFSVSVDKLYQAWVGEEALKQWWHPIGNQLRNVKNDLKEGGEVVYEFETSDGKEAFIISGIYQEVIPNSKLVYTWDWQFDNQALSNSEFLLTVEFEEADGGSKIIVTQQNTSEDETVQPHHESWEKGLEDLSQYLQQ